MISAIILAGGKKEKELESLTDLSSKAFIKLNGRYMIEYVIDSLASSGLFEKTVLVLPKEYPKSIITPNTYVSFSGNSMIESLASGIEKLTTEDSVLIFPCDIVLLKPEIIISFADSCRQRDLELGYGYVPESCHTGRFKNIRHTYASLKEGRFCGSGLFYMKPKIFPKLKDLSIKITKLRKSPVKLAGLFGFAFLLKLLFRQLTVKEIE